MGKGRSTQYFDIVLLTQPHVRIFITRTHKLSEGDSFPLNGPCGAVDPNDNPGIVLRPLLDIESERNARREASRFWNTPPQAPFLTTHIDTFLTIGALGEVQRVPGVWFRRHHDKIRGGVLIRLYAESNERHSLQRMKQVQTKMAEVLGREDATANWRTELASAMTEALEGVVGPHFCAVNGRSSVSSASSHSPPTMQGSSTGSPDSGIRLSTPPGPLEV